MWVHMHLVRTPVHPFNYNNVYKVLALNSLFSIVVFIVHNQS